MCQAEELKFVMKSLSGSDVASAGEHLCSCPLHGTDSYTTSPTLPPQAREEAISGGRGDGEESQSRWVTPRT